MGLPTKELGSTWKDLLNLSGRKPPEFYENPDDIKKTPHANAIRTAFTELDLSSVFCVQGVPTVAIIKLENYDHEAIVKLHASLWNQGLASILLVLTNNTVRVFSLARIPKSDENADAFNNRCLVKTLRAVTDALALKNIIYGAESGRLWKKYANHFRAKERIDHVLLENLSESHRELCSKDEDLSSDSAQALLIQAMFIAYLEDRKIIGQEYFFEASNGNAKTFSELLQLAKPHLLKRLFESLQEDFNGDLFFAPCSFDVQEQQQQLKGSHLKILGRFCTGNEEMSSGQSRFWGYDFKYIPVELISAVYDRFLGDKKAEQRKKQGAYYTPMFLADTTISQVWEMLSPEMKNKGKFLDPACGSGIFLVRSFQRLCEHWRETQKSQALDWGSLLSILSRLHGYDLNDGAVRVAVFSLYIALLEEVSPPDIRLLIESDKVLPKLWDRTLCVQDFFKVHPHNLQAEIVIGNPPWLSRRKQDRSSIKWCATQNLPMPSKEEAWAFAWKSIRHLPKHGKVAFLLPAMGFLHNHQKSTVDARNRFIRETRILRIINFSDLRFQLFEGATRPAALVIFERGDPKALSYRFDYWAPKADLNLKAKRLITLSSADKSLITSQMTQKDSSVFKRRLWINDPEAKLFNYLALLPKLSSLVSEYGGPRPKKQIQKTPWIIGHGFIPASHTRLDDSSYNYKHSKIVANTPFLPIAKFRVLVQNCTDLRPWKNGKVYREGFQKGFQGTRVLVPRGIIMKQQRLRATYVQDPITFRHIILTIVVPHGEERRAKLLTTLLNSKLLLWFTFHGTASFGSDRPEVQQAELLRLPFPSPEDLPDPKKAESAASSLVSLIDERIKLVQQSHTLHPSDTEVFDEIDQLTYTYFCLSKEEVTLVEDTVKNIIPAVQPSQGKFPEIWEQANGQDRQAYAATLAHSLRQWLKPNSAIQITLEARNKDLIILRLNLEEGRNVANYTENNDRSVGEVLADLSQHIHQPLQGNFQLMPDFRLFIGKTLYLVKPAQKRFWLKSSALADANAIALDLHDVAWSSKNQSCT